MAEQTLDASSLLANVEWERKPKNIDANLKDYDAAYTAFKWKDVEREFTWAKTGKVNIVHEAIDRHADGPRGNEPALSYTDFERRTETYSFKDFQRLRSEER